MNRRASLWLLLVVLCLPLAVAAQPPRQKQRPVLLLLAANLTLDDLRPGGSLPAVRKLADSGGIALMNAAVAGQSTRAAAFLTIGGADRLAAPATSIQFSDETGRRPTAAQIALDVRQDSPHARAIYQKRYGTPPPRMAALLHLGLPALRPIQSNTARADRIGALGDALRDAGRGTVAYGAPAALVLTDSDGLVNRGSLARPVSARLSQALPGGDVIAIYLADNHALNAFAAAALPLVRQGRADIVVACVPPPPESGERWNRLGFMICAGMQIPARSLLYSPTTRMHGEAASVDIAPTVLQMTGVNAAFGGAGRALRAHPAKDAWRELAENDRQTVSATRNFLPVTVTYVAAAIITGFLCVAFVAMGWARTDIPRFALHTIAATLIAFLPLSLVSPATFIAYALLLGVISVAISAAAWALWRRFGMSPLGTVLTAIVIVVTLDAFMGGHLESRALLSGYLLAGIRFYGIGNEYMGLAIGAALIGPILLRRREDRSQPSPLLILFWIAITAAIGVPAWGANAGGAVTAAVAFTVAFFALRGPLRRRHIAAAFAAAIALTLALALADRMRPVDQRTHMGMALSQPRHKGANPLLDIIVRKIGMNASIVTAPGTLATLAGMIPIWWLLSRGALGMRTRRSLERRPALQRMIPAVGWGAAAAFLFNDSGVVAAIILAAPLTGAVVDSLLEDTALTPGESAGAAAGGAEP